MSGRCEGTELINQNCKWHLAQIKPNSQDIALRNLTRQGFETFAPNHNVTRRHRGKFVARTQPLFPGYLFVSINVLEGGWRSINNTYGVSRLVSFGADPVAVPSQLVEDLMLRCDDSSTITAPKLLKQGDEVRLLEGPFSDFVATVESVQTDQRIWILLDIMGRTTRAAVKERILQVV